MQIIIATNGGINLDDLLHMPLLQYLAIKRAVDLEVFHRRKIFIHDVSQAVANPNQALKALDKSIRELDGGGSGNRLIWTADEDAADRARKLLIGK